MHVYLDESGDLGFDFKKRGTSKYFSITIFLTKKPKRVINCIRHLKRNALQKKYKKIPEIKFNNSPLSFKKGVLKKLSQQNIFILVFVLNKPKVFAKLHDKKDKVYNYVTGLLFDKILPLTKPGEDLTMTVDKVKTGKIQIEDFNFYMGLRMFLAGQSQCRLKILHEDSRKSNCLQAVDFISGAIFKKYELRKPELYDLIKDKIIWEIFWPK